METRLQQKYFRTSRARYGLGVGLFAMALLMRALLVPLEARLTFSTSYPAVALTMYLCGIGPGALIAALGAAAGIFFFSPPYLSWGADSGGYLSAVAFLVTSAVFGWVVHRLQATSLEMRAAMARVAEVSGQMQDLYDHAPCGYFSLDARRRFVRLNATQMAWLGCPIEEVVGKLGPADFCTAQGATDFDAHFSMLVSQGQGGPIEFDLLSRDGSVRRVSMSSTAIRGRNGAFRRSRSVMHDITQISRVRQELRESNRQQEAMLDNELVGIVKLKDRHALWTNRALGQMFGYAPGELDGQPARLLYLDDESYEALGEAAYPTLRSGGTYRTQLRMRHRDGRAIWVDLSGALISAESGESMWMMLDISAMKEQHERVQAVAFNDALTGLPNRLLLADRLQQAIAMAERLRCQIAVCFIDLDGFKAINDQLGHAAGDRLLRVIAHRLLECVRSHDTVARLGGDEFIVLMTQLQSRIECDQVLARVIKGIEEPVDLGHPSPCRVSASVGVAFCPDDGIDVDTLVQAADAAMYAMKRSGRRREGAA